MRDFFLAYWHNDIPALTNYCVKYSVFFNEVYPSDACRGDFNFAVNFFEFYSVGLVAITIWICRKLLLPSGPAHKLDESGKEAK